MMKNDIAIWAPLRYSNYGDDLQAIVFAHFIKSLGFSVIVFQMEQELADYYGLKVAHNVNELCANSKLCIIAGGALLTPFLLPQRIVSKPAYEYENDFKDLHNAGKKFGTKFCAISMGGDGKSRNPYLYYSLSRIEFFKSPWFIDGTVRLEGDIQQMKKFGKSFKYYPDCLLQTPRWLKMSSNSSPGSNKCLKVALNFKKRHLPKKLLDDILQYAQTHNDIEFYFVTTHLEKSGIKYEFIPENESKNVKIIKYSTPTQLLEFIKGVDVLVTSKLHLGITGLTVNTPFLIYQGPGKAKSFAKTIGGEWSVLDDAITFDDLLKNYLLVGKKNLMDRYNTAELKKIIDESKFQFEFCRNILNKHS